MTSKSSDYFRDLPATPDMARWGLGVAAGGRTHIPPGASYPPEHHPQDHQFDWQHDRVLDALQIVLISAGGGWLETRATGKRRITAGMAFLILPQSWHRSMARPRTTGGVRWRIPAENLENRAMR